MENFLYLFDKWILKYLVDAILQCHLRLLLLIHHVSLQAVYQHSYKVLYLYDNFLIKVDLEKCKYIHNNLFYSPGVHILVTGKRISSAPP